MIRILLLLSRERIDIQHDNAVSNEVFANLFDWQLLAHLS